MGTFTQKFVMYSCILALVFGGTHVQAGNGNASKFPNVNTIGKVPNTGFLINTQVDDGVPHATGSSARLSGHIDLPTKWGDGHGHGNIHNNRNHGHSGHGNDDDSDSSNLLQYLSEAGYEVHAFFPDATTEVTSAIHLTSDLQYSFVTPALSAANQNILSIMVTKLTPSSQKLISVQAKLNQKILSFTEVLHRQQALHANSGKIQSIQALIAVLQKISQRITDKLAPRTEILAESHFAIQVDNKIAAASFNSTLMGNFRVTTSFNVGSAIEGEKVKVTSTVTRLGDVTDDDAISDDDDDAHDYAGYWTSPKWIAKFLWQGSQVFQSAAQALAPGASVSYTYDTPALSPSSQSQDNVFSISVHSVYDSWTGPELANLSLKEPVAADNTSPAWMLAGSTPDAQHAFVKTVQPISSQVQDSFGLMNPSGFKATLQGTLGDGASTVFTTDVTNKLTFQTIDQGATYHVSGDLNPLPEGIFTLKLSAEDYAQNAALPNPFVATFRIDRTPPVTTLGMSDGVLTNQRNFNLPVTVTDYSPTLTTVQQNGVPVFESAAPIFDAAGTLQEGLNVFTVTSVDSAQNVGATVGLYNVVLDTVPPVLTIASPAPGAILNSLSINISGSSNELLSQITLNNQAVTLSADKKSYTVTFVAPTEGDFNLHFLAYDLAGNTTSKDISGKIVLKVLNGNLLSVRPDSNSSKLVIVGAPGAARPGVTVNASGGFFNSGSAVSGADGSFLIYLSAFSQATVTATDAGQTDTATVNFGLGGNTSLAGVIKDTSGNPLAGATVQILNGIAKSVTDSNGVFTLSPVETGNQTILVDGTTIPLSTPPAPQRTFSSTRMIVNIGVSQSNQLSRPIFLQPIPLDGTAATVSVASGGTVSNPVAAPGVTLDIPAGAAKFPSGASVGKIAMATIPAQYSTVAAPDFVQPTQVVALEPSGTTFSTPVDLTLPNTSQLPSGIDVVIMSMDSNRGTWVVDGVGTVSSDGQSIVTKPGQGITHFSVVFASPIGPKVAAIGSQDKPGADTFNGALSTSIAMPSYKSLGQNITPSLVYKSAWANPTVLVTNLFDIPPQTITISHRYEVPQIEQVIKDETVAWYAPDFITAQFSTNGITSDKLTFTGLPQKSVISYAVNLKDPNTQNVLPSDVYSYNSSYEIHLKQMVISTRHHVDFRWAREGADFAQESVSSSTAIQQAFPQDFSGQLYVQNETRSPAGIGWKIAGAQRIANTSANRLMLEEADGSIAGYALGNAIDTLYDATSASGVDLTKGVSLSNWPYAQVTQNAPGWNDKVKIDEVDLSQPMGTSFQTIASLPSIQGLASIVENGPPPCYYYPYQIDKRPSQILKLPDGRSIIVDSANSSVYLLDASANYQPLIARTTYIGAQIRTELDLYYESQFFTRFGLPNSSYNGVSVSSNPTCSGYAPSQGDVPVVGAFDGALSDASLNSPRGIVAGQAANTFLVADTGNNKIRLLDLNAGTVSTFAGTGQSFDSGDGGQANLASLYHPQSLVYDVVGNLYITTERGFIRKIAQNGVITTFAGKLATQGGIVGDKIPAIQAVLNRPYGMVVDNDNGYLYFADTGANLVRKIDFQTQILTNVAGTGAVGFNGDGGAALNATLTAPTFVGLDSSKNLIIVDSGNNKIRRVTFNATPTGILSFAPTALDHTILIRNADSTWTRKYRNGTQVFFDANGRQVGSLDRVGRQTAYSYDNLGRLLSMTDPVGRQTIYNYSGANLSSVTDPAGRTTQFFYASGYLTQVQFPDGTTRSYTYNDQGLLASETNERGFASQYTYNQLNRLASVTRADNTTVTVNDSGSASAANNYTGGAQGKLQTFGSNSGQLYDGIKDAKNVETKFVKDSSGFITTIIDGKGRTTTVARDIKGKPTLITRPDNTTVSFSYDSNTGDLLSQTDSALGITTSQTFDVYGNQLTSINGRGYTSQASYDPATGLLISKTDPLGHGGSAFYGVLGLLSKSVDALGKQSLVTYDSAGNIASVKDALNFTTVTTRDLAGNVLNSTNAKNQKTIYTYDSFNRLTSVTTPKNETTVYSYNADGSLAQITDPLSNLVSFQYDQLGRLISKTDALGFVTTRTYDQNSNVVTETDPNGNLKQFSYDNLNQLIQKTLPDNVVSMSFDVRGNLTQAANQQSVVNLEYDNGGRLVSSQTYGAGSYANILPNVTLNFHFDNNGNRVRLDDPTGSNVYSFDQADRLYQLVNARGETYSFGFDAANRITSMGRPGGSTALAFDDRNFLTSIVHSHGSNALSGFSYQMDQIGNRTQIATSAGARNLAYDNNNQLSSASNPEAPVSASGFANEFFNYDSIANRTSDQGGSYTFDAKSQRLKQDYRYFYFFDNNGNLISKQAKFGMVGETTNFTYSSENQLVAFKVYAQNSNIPYKEVVYAYDALGRRVAKQVLDHNLPNTVTKTFSRNYVYDGQELLLEYDGTNNLLARYTHSSLHTDDVLSVDVRQAGANAALAQSAGSYQYLKDVQGTIVDIADSSGNKIQHYLYSAFGVILGIQDANAADISANPSLRTNFAFTGREFDSESGYYFYRARYYNPNTGRFLQKDPYPGLTLIPATVVNSYVYVANNPANLTDASGKFWGALVAAVGIGGALAGLGIGAIFGGLANYSDIKNTNASPIQIFASVAIGAIIGAAVFAVAAITFPEIGPLGGIAAAGLGAGLNNFANQALLRGPDNVNWGRVGRATLSGFGTGALSAGIGEAIYAWPGVTDFYRVVGESTGSAIAGTCVDSGVPDKDPEAIMVCGQAAIQ